jgi:DNA-binding CsgD family transcriptional regulator
VQRAEANGFDLSNLTERERDVFELVVQQVKRERDVARILGISKGTVTVNKRKIARKLGLKYLCRVETPLPEITLQNPEAQAALSRLTRKEKEVFILVLQHKTEKDIAQIMGIGEPAVNFHERHILGKLGMPSTARLISVFGDDEEVTLEKLESDPIMRKALEKGLSPRREQLIELVEWETPTEAIAAKMHLTVESVYTYMCTLFRKLKVRDRDELIEWNNRRRQYRALISAQVQPEACQSVEPIGET